VKATRWPAASSARAIGASGSKCPAPPTNATAHARADHPTSGVTPPTRPLRRARSQRRGQRGAAAGDPRQHEHGGGSGGVAIAPRFAAPARRADGDRGVQPRERLVLRPGRRGDDRDRSTSTVFVSSIVARAGWT